MNSLYNTYGEDMITGVLCDYIINGDSQEKIANKRGLNQRSDVSPIVKGCNFNPGPRREFQSGVSRGEYKNGKPHQLENGNTISVTPNVVRGFVRAWKNNESLTFSDYMERTYGGGTSNFSSSSFFNNTPTKSKSSYNSGSYGGYSSPSPSYGGSSGTKRQGENSSSMDDETLAMGCASVFFIVLAIFLLPKIPLIGGLFAGLFGAIKNAALGGLLSLACILSPFGEFIAAMGVLVIGIGKMLAIKNATRIGGTMIFSGLALLYSPSGNILAILICIGIAIVIYQKKK